MNYSSFFAFFFFLSSVTFSQHVSHQLWDGLLKKHVSAEGVVNYAALKANKSTLNQYLTLLEKTTPSSSWSKEEHMAFWINAYNAYTVALILKHYPLKSINDIQSDGKKPWDISFVKVGGKSYTLNHIEHEILRKTYFDPRIHFAVNCASFSCPPLLNQAFTAANLHSKMDFLAKAFINDKTRNNIGAQSAQLSQIFDWFKGDFTKSGTLVDFLNKYANTKLTSSTKITYLNYNWTLNE
jgi:hypothetical protein